MTLRLKAGLTLYFARHGQTKGNTQKRFQGRAADTPLTALGEEQARHIAAILKQEVKAPTALAFVASPLQRACRTMEIVRGSLGLPPKGYTTDDRLQELDLGQWDGLTDAEAKARDPELYRERESDKWNIRIPGGENYADVATRAESWIGDLAADTFAVTHGGFTRVLRGLFGGLGWRDISSLDEPQGCVFKVSGGVVTKLDD
jgi:broad specificity phosphatase PhoE